ncbi:MAG TPA: glycosyltransferase family 9 protein, partial [bacterium]
KQSMDADILLTEGPGEAALVNAVQQKIGGPILRAGVLPLRFLAAVLSRCNAFVTNDCGPMHMAPAVGTPTIGIFGPGEPEIWFPYRPEKGHRFVHAEIGCSRCHRDQCQKLDCMEAVTVDMVSEAVRASVCGGAK